MSSLTPSFKRLILMLLFLSLPVLTVLGHPPQTNEPRELPPNQTLERAMTGAETHRYKFNAKANEFFQVRVEQKGVDVALKLLDENGNVLATMDTPNGKEGVEALSFIAANAGSLILEISSVEAKAEKRLYVIKREAARTATEKDKRRVQVERVFVEGIKARDTEGQAEIGIAKFEEALKGWQELDDSYLAELTRNSVTDLKANKYSATFLKLFKELNKASEVLREGSLLALRAKADSLSARTKINEALTMYRALDAKVNDKVFVEKINQASQASQRPLNNLKFLQFYVKSGETSCSDVIAQTHYNLGEWEERIAYLKLSLAGYQKLTTDKSLNSVIEPQTLRQLKILEAVIWQQIGESFETLGKPVESLNYLHQALEHFHFLSEESQDSQVKFKEADVLGKIGIIYGRESRNGTQAIEFLTKSLDIYRAFPDKKVDAASTLSLIALIYMRNLQYEEAQERFEAALRIYREIDNSFYQSQILQTIGGIYAVLNNKSKVKEYVNQSLALLQSPDYVEKWLTYSTKNFAGFEAYAEWNKEFIEYQRLNGIGDAYRLLEDHQKSLEYYEKALAVASAGTDLGRVRLNLRDVGYTLGELGRWNEAATYYQRALAISRSQGDRESTARDLQDAGWVLLEAGKPNEALSFENETILTYQSVGVEENKTFSPSFSALLNHLSRTHDAIGNRRLAIFYGKRAVNAMQGERQRLQNLDLIAQKGFLEKKEKHYRRLADWLIEEGKFAQAEQVLRMLKEEEYANFVRRDANEIKTLDQRIELKGTERELMEKYQLLADRVGEIGKKFFALEEKRDKLANRNLKLTAAEGNLHQQLSEELATANAAFKLFLDKELVAELGKERVEKIEVDRTRQEKLRKLGADTVLLYTVVGEDRYRVILTTPTVQVDGKYEIKAAKLNKKVHEFRAALQNPQIDPRPLGKELYDILIKPIEKDLQAAGAKTLVWSLDGTLRYIPLAALSPDGKSYLVEKYQNVIITPKTSDDISTQSTHGQVLGLGVSQAKIVSDPNAPEKKLEFPALLGTKTELAAIVKEGKSPSEKGVLTGKRFLDENFTAQNFIESLQEKDGGKRKYTVIHIASHFYLGSDWFNSFLLLGDGRILTLAEISSSPNIKFGDVELITLSACNTAFADEDNGKQVDSLAEVIQTKSGKAVLATLWAVADQSTALLMSEFYRLRKANPKLTKGEAIQLAQLAMIAGKPQPSTPQGARRGLAMPLENSPGEARKPYAHPFYWSPFILIGNWR